MGRVPGASPVVEVAREDPSDAEASAELRREQPVFAGAGDDLVDPGNVLRARSTEGRCSSFKRSLLEVELQAQP